MTAAERQKRYRARKAQAGKARLSIYLGGIGRARLAERWNCSPSEVIGVLLREACEGQHRRIEGSCG